METSAILHHPSTECGIQTQIHSSPTNPLFSVPPNPETSTKSSQPIDFALQKIFRSYVKGTSNYEERIKWNNANPDFICSQCIMNNLSNCTPKSAVSIRCTFCAEHQKICSRVEAERRDTTKATLNLDDQRFDELFDDLKKNDSSFRAKIRMKKGAAVIQGGVHSDANTFPLKGIVSDEYSYSQISIQIPQEYEEMLTIAQLESRNRVVSSIGSTGEYPSPYGVDALSPSLRKLFAAEMSKQPYYTVYMYWNLANPSFRCSGCSSDHLECILEDPSQIICINCNNSEPPRPCSRKFAETRSRTIKTLHLSEWMFDLLLAHAPISFGVPTPPSSKIDGIKTYKAAAKRKRDELDKSADLSHGGSISSASQSAPPTLTSESSSSSSTPVHDSHPTLSSLHALHDVMSGAAVPALKRRRGRPRKHPTNPYHKRRSGNMPGINPINQSLDSQLASAQEETARLRALVVTSTQSQENNQVPGQNLQERLKSAEEKLQQTQAKLEQALMEVENAREVARLHGSPVTIQESNAVTEQRLQERLKNTEDELQQTQTRLEQTLKKLENAEKITRLHEFAVTEENNMVTDQSRQERMESVEDLEQTLKKTLAKLEKTQEKSDHTQDKLGEVMEKNARLEEIVREHETEDAALTQRGIAEHTNLSVLRIRLRHATEGFATGTVSPDAMIDACRNLCDQLQEIADRHLSKAPVGFSHIMDAMTFDTTMGTEDDDELEDDGPPLRRKRRR